jgi:phage terminase Nu1 subunit (DNA packaging protein)
MSGNLVDSYMEKLFALVKNNPNDADLGREVRKLLDRIPEHLKKRYS